MCGLFLILLDELILKAVVDENPSLMNVGYNIGKAFSVGLIGQDTVPWNTHHGFLGDDGPTKGLLSVNIKQANIEVEHKVIVHL